MRVAYVPSEQDRHYVLQRVVDESSVARLNWRRYVMTFGVSTVVIAAGFLLMMPRSTVAGNILMTAFLFVMGLVVLPYLDRRSRRRNIQHELQRVAQEDPGSEFAVELRPEGFWYADGKSEVLTQWSEIHELRETPSYLEFWLKPYGLVVVARRAFATTDEWAAFEQRARQLTSRDAALS